MLFVVGEGNRFREGDTVYASVFDFEVIQQCFVMVLGCEAGVSEVSVDFSPVAEASVVE